ncbi:MAG: regulator of sigma E protease [Enterobacterales bacterium]|jgi:regulator of sigma E protease
MLGILWDAASFVVALGILVTIHEYGHFWVARKLGIKVLRFSIGFGKALWSRKAADGTEYVIAVIPLGGYVKMLDEREGDVPEDEKHLAFNRKPVLTRIAVVIAGPLANFLLAFFVYWWMFVLGVPAMKPVLGDIPVASIAAQAGLQSGDEIVAIDGKSVGNFREVGLALARRMGETTEIEIAVRHDGDSVIRKHSLQLKNWEIDAKNPDIFNSLGISRWRPTTIFPIIGEIQEGQAVSKSALEQGDQILKVNAQAISTWQELVEIIIISPDKKLQLLVQRGDETFEIELVAGHREREGKLEGFLGVGPQYSKSQMANIESMRYNQQYGFFDAIGQGIDKTWEITLLTLRFIGKLFTGEVSPQNLGGPITIAQGAGAYASYGFVFFLNFLGMISINLGIVNLLPIPVLDGGHLMYYIVELIRGKPLSESFQDMGYRIGLLLVLSLMVFTIFNDISRF